MKVDPQSPQIKSLENARQQAEVDDRKFIPKPYLEMAKNMEQQFAEFMLKEMHKTTSEEGGDTASDYYKSLMTSEQGEKMVNKGSGLGIQDLILDQVYPKHRRSEMAYNAYKQQESAQMGNKPSMIRMEKDYNSQGDIDRAVDKALGNGKASNEGSSDE